jgi:hypothetical protein
MRQMIIRASVFCLIVLLFPCLKLHSVQQVQQSDQPTGIAKMRVRVFDFRGSMLDALLQVGRQEHLPLGIEYLDPNDLDEPISVQLHGTSVGAVVNAILNQRRGYTWRIEKGVILIGHPGMPSGERNLLDVVLREFSVPERTVLFTAATVMLRAQLERQLHPPKPTPGAVGTVGSISGGRIENQVGPLTLRNVTVRQVLDRLVSQDNNAAWVILVPPTRLDRLPPKGLWYIIEYNAPQDNWTGFIGRLLRENWPPRSLRKQK